MGALYDPADYPAVGKVRQKFRMDIAIFPVPSDDFRVDLATEELEHIQQDVQIRVEKASQDAMRDVWQRLYDKVAWFADRLSDPKHTFNTATYEAIGELCDLLPRLNFSDDPELETLRLQVEEKLAGHHPDAIRNDPDLRRVVAQDADAIMSQMRGFMEG